MHSKVTDREMNLIRSEIGEANQARKTIVRAIERKFSLTSEQLRGMIHAQRKLKEAQKEVRDVSEAIAEKVLSDLGKI